MVSTNAIAAILILFIQSHVCTVTDHGISNIETTLEEGLQDIPPLVGEIQERLESEWMCVCLCVCVCVCYCHDADSSNGVDCCC